jgi:glycosyltransferase involved in cell wall biosynthesis
LVVDGYSSDDTDEVVTGYNDNRIRLLKIHNPLGIIGLPRNLGIREAYGEYIAFLDSDDWWAPRKLEESLTYLEKGNDLVYHDLLVVTKHNQRVFWRKARTRALKSPAFEDLIANGNALNNSSVVMRRDILNSISGLSEDPRLIAIEDYDAWLRVARITEKFERIPRALGYYWIGGENTSNPSRTIELIDTIEERYSGEFISLDKDVGISWLAYARGRAHYQLGSYTDAKKYLEMVNQRHPSLLIFIKTYWMLCIIKIYKFMHRV